MHRRFAWKLRHWAVLGSALWMITAYTIWLRHFGLAPNFAFAQAQAQCDSGIAHDSYFYAQCLRNAMEAFQAQYVEAASGALFAAIVPVTGLWVMLIGHHLWSCSDTPYHSFTSDQFPDLDWRARIERKRAIRTNPSAHELANSFTTGFETSARGKYLLASRTSTCDSKVANASVGEFWR
jgi:hypothetical protein